MTIKNQKNEGLVGHFTRLGSLYQKSKNNVKAGTFFKIARIISDLEEEVDLDYKLTQHAGCGASSQKEVTEFLKTGSSSRLQELVLNPEIPMENLQEKIARLLITKDASLGGRPISTDLLMTVAINGMLSTVDSYIENIKMFDQYLLDAGLEEILNKLKTNPNL